MFVSPWKRRILVNRFQYRLIAGNFLYLISVVIAFFVVLFGPLVAVLADASTTTSQREVASYQMLILEERVWFVVPVLIALCIFHSALVSHRIAGPLVRFKRIFADLAQGDLSMDVRVRQHDYLQEEAELMAEMVNRLGSRIQSIHDDYRQASLTLPRLMEAMGSGATEHAAVLAGKLGTQMDILGRQIGEFRMPGDTEHSVVEPQPATPEQPALTV